MTTERLVAEAAERARALSAAGARVLAAPADDLGTALGILSRDAGVTSIVLEGGAGLHAAALDAGIVDLVQLYIAPLSLGPRALAWIGERRLAWEALHDRSAVWLGGDVMVQGYVHRNR